MTDTNPAACDCGHRVVWHHDTRGCGFHGFADSRCPCRLSSDAAVERIIAARTEAADREVARVTAAVEALADEWESWAGGRSTIRIDAFRDAAEHLRAALSSADTTALDDLLDRERAKAAAQAWLEGHAAGREYQGDGWNSDAHDPDRDNPYRAAAVSPEGGGA